MSLAGMATTIHDFMNAGPGTGWGLVCILLVGIPVTLVHELGHAFVAQARLGSEVRVTVGNAGRVGTVRFGRLTTTLNAFQLPTRIGGAARFDARRATPQDMVWISLAGPAASFAGGLLAGIAYRQAPASGVVHDLLWAAVFDSVFAVANLIPLRLRERRAGLAFSTDGMVAISALAMMFTRRSRRPDAHMPIGARESSDHVCADRSEVGVRVWRHDDHLHIGVGAKDAFERQAAAVTTILPATARDIARVIVELAGDAEHATPAQASATRVQRGLTDAADGSVAPPGYTN